MVTTNWIGSDAPGTTIPSGDYLLWTERYFDEGGYVSSSNIFNGGISAIMGIADDEFYQKEYKNISLPNETTLSIHDVTIKLIFKE